MSLNMSIIINVFFFLSILLQLRKLKLSTREKEINIYKYFKSIYIFLPISLVIFLYLIVKEILEYVTTSKIDLKFLSNNLVSLQICVIAIITLINREGITKT